MSSIEIIPFKSFKEKIRITKKYGRKARIEIIDNKYVVVKEKEGERRARCYHRGY